MAEDRKFLLRDQIEAAQKSVNAWPKWMQDAATLTPISRVSQPAKSTQSAPQDIGESGSLFGPKE